MAFEIKHGDCLEVMRGMADNSVDAIVTDPPYGLSFMGKKWDYDVPEQAIWEECLRVLKPGGHLLAFAGTRTQHRMCCRIEDAGFEIRDMIAWVYCSGFPKSHSIGKAIDREAGERGAVGKRFVAAGGDLPSPERNYDDPPLVLEAAKQWQGWGTALKPSIEPVTVARKPLVGTVAANVLEHGTGALNIDGCRVEGTPAPTRFDPAKHGHEGWRMNATGAECAANASPLGRWPANLIHDGSEEVLALFPDSNGSGPARTLNRSAKPDQQGWGMNTTGADAIELRDAGTGSAARFFYCAKASRSDRNAGLEGMEERPGPGSKRTNPAPGRQAALGAPRANHHPTVKPTDLMRYLCRLVTPPGGTVLDPFTGSGSTGRGAVLEGFSFIGIEREAEYIPIAEARIAEAQKSLGLFA